MTRRLLPVVTWPTICAVLGLTAGLYTRWRY